MYLYQADSNNNLIRRIVIATSAVTTIAGNSAGYGGYVDGVGTVARFSGPTVITLDALGAVALIVGPMRGVGRRNLLIYTRTPTNLQCDKFNHMIRRLDVSSASVSTLAGGNGSLVPKLGYADGIGTNVLFNYPEAVAIDAAGSVALVVSEWPVLHLRVHRLCTHATSLWCAG